jgi:hypothetical protein
LGRLASFAAKIDRELVLQEAMYGFVMALTFITAAQLGLVDYSDRRETLILAIFGMDFVWGVIDMYIFYRMDMFSMADQIGFLRRLYMTKDKESMRQEVSEQLDGTIFNYVDEGTRRNAEDLLMQSTYESSRNVKSDRRRYLFNAVTCFVVTVGTVIPAWLCLTFIPDDTDAYFWTSVSSSVALFFIGYWMSPYESKFLKAGAGIVTAAVCMLLTVFAAYFGG